MSKTNIGGSHLSDMQDTLDIRLNGEVAGVWPSVTERPADGSTKEKWVDHAVSLGLDRALAEEKSRNELIKWCYPDAT